MLRVILAVMGLTIALSGPAPAAAAEGGIERAVLVLDASGSMWGQVDSTPKIEIARNVIRTLISDWNPKVQLGVTAYGHREKGNCADIETLIPVGDVDADAIMTTVNGLNPKGKTPLSDAIRQAARALKYTEERATVILVSDGKETCNANPCAVAAELEADGIDFTVHVVGFDLTDEEKTQLQCIADKTGGKFLSADSAPELHTAMAATVQLVAEPAAPKKRVIKLKTAAVGSLSVKNVVSDVVYVYEPGKAYSNNIDRFKAGREKPQQLKSGTYVLGTSKQELARVDIAPGEDLVVDMNDLTGTLSVKNVVSDAIYVYEPGKAYSNNIDRFKAGRAEPQQLKPGTYVLGTSRQELIRVEIAAGKDVVVDMNDVTGSLSVRNVISDAVYVYEPGKAYSDNIDRFKAGRENPQQLKPGTYVLGTSRQELIRVDIAAGKDVVVDMNDVTGSLSVRNVISDVVYVYEPGKAYSNNIDRFKTGREEPQAGSGKVDTGFPSGPALTHRDRSRFIDLGGSIQVDRDLERDQEKWTPVFRPIPLQNVRIDHVLST